MEVAAVATMIMTVANMITMNTSVAAVMKIIATMKKNAAAAIRKNTVVAAATMNTKKNTAAVLWAS